MFIATAYQFLEYLRSVKNASEHTIRNYAIDLNALKNFLEIDLLKDCKPEDIPDKISYSSLYQDRWQGKDKILSLQAITKKHLSGFLANLNSKNSNKRTIVRR